MECELPLYQQNIIIENTRTWQVYPFNDHLDWEHFCRDATVLYVGCSMLPALHVPAGHEQQMLQHA